MEVEILGTESLGVRGLSCFVRAKNRRILIDPGIALGYFRYGFLPHPLQVAVDERIQDEIIKRWSISTDIVISHFDGDHVPLADANPYQLDVNRLVRLNRNARLWVKDFKDLSPLEKKREDVISRILGLELIQAEGKSDGVLEFSRPVPHGFSSTRKSVMMTKVEDGDTVLVHASDVQLLNKESIEQIITWNPDVVFIDGPPLYRERREGRYEIAWHNALKLSSHVKLLIIDHHLLRCEEGELWLDRLSSKTKNDVICAADFMKRPRTMLEAWRKQLYKEIPVPEGWHSAYAEGTAKAGGYLDLARSLYGNFSKMHSSMKRSRLQHVP